MAPDWEVGSGIGHCILPQRHRRTMHGSYISTQSLERPATEWMRWGDEVVENKQKPPEASHVYIYKYIYI